jgi:restriction endonuclease S subunit
VRLSEVCDTRTGFTPRGKIPTTDTGDVRVISIGDFSPDGHVEIDRLPRMAAEDAPARNLVSPGDVLFRSRGERTTSWAVPDHLRELILVVSPIYVLRPDTRLVLPEFLAWTLNQSPAQKYFDATAHGTSIRMVPKSSLDDLEIDLPDLNSQHLIASVEALAARERTLTERGAALKHQLVNRLLVDETRRIPTDIRLERATE